MRGQAIRLNLSDRGIAVDTLSGTLTLGLAVARTLTLARAHKPNPITQICTI